LNALLYGLSRILRTLFYCFAGILRTLLHGFWRLVDAGDQLVANEQGTWFVDVVLQPAIRPLDVCRLS
jgi:hypothetical protein